MFTLSDETKAQIVELVRSHFNITAEQHSDEDINEFIDKVVGVVKAQFGM
jgi:hypothetical protein